MPHTLRNRRVVLTGSAARAFSPADIPGLLWWAKGDTLAGLADAAALSQWDDSSGQNNHIVQVTGVNQPTKQTATNNGKTFATARFDGSNDYLTRASFAWTQEYTLFLVAKAAGSGTYRALDGDNTPRQFLFFFSGSNFSMTAFSTASNFQDNQAVTPTNWNVISGVRRASNVQVYVNGASDGSTATTGTPQSGTGTFAVGAGWTGNNPFNGDMAEALFFNVALSDANRQLVQTYLGAKYGVTVS